MAMIVYTATNKVNGKVYVGITMQPLKSRIAQHKSRAKKGGRAFSNAIAKYGVDGFDWVIVQQCETAHALNLAEQEWIAKLGCLADGGHGYNRTTGGAGTAGCSPSAETRAKQSDVRRRGNWTRFPANRQIRMFKGRVNYKHSEAAKAKISEANKGRRNNLKLRDEWMPEIVQMYESGTSQSLIASKFGVTRPAISYALKRVGARP